MAQVFGTPGEEWGDEEIYKTLQKLPDRYLIYSQPVISHDGKERFPDYVLIDPGQGVIVLEVKDWVNILEVRADEVRIQRVEGKQQAWETHPLKQAQDACYLLMDTLQKDPELIHRSGYLEGKLTFPVEYAAFLPHQPASTISQIVQARGDGRIFGKSELDPDILKKRLAEFPYTFGMFQDLSERQLELIRPILDPRLIIRTEDGVKKGVLDIGQEKLAKEPLGDITDSRDEMVQQAIF